MIDDHVDADPQDGDIVEPADEGSDRGCAGRGDRVAERGGDGVTVALEPLPSATGLDVLPLDGLDARERLD